MEDSLKYNEMRFYSPSGQIGDIRTEVHEISEDVVFDKAKMFFTKPEEPVYLIIYFIDDISEKELTFLYSKLIARGLITLDVGPDEEAKEDLKESSLENTSFEIKCDGDFRNIFDCAKEIFNDFNMPGGIERVMICIRDCPSLNMKHWLENKMAEDKDASESEVQ